MAGSRGLTLFASEPNQQSKITRGKTYLDESHEYATVCKKVGYFGRWAAVAQRFYFFLALGTHSYTVTGLVLFTAGLMFRQSRYTPAA